MQRYSRGRELHDRCAVAAALIQFSMLGAGMIVIQAAAQSQPALNTIYAFTGGADGAGPIGIVRGRNGVFYGSTVGGGASGDGTVFQLTPPAVAGGAWTETVLYSFTGQNGTGTGPVATPTLGPLERLFGTTYSGGASGWGIAFELTPPPPAGGIWKESVLYNFPAVVDGTQVLAGLVIGPNGALYGTTWNGGAYDRGTAYELAPSGGGWTETTLYSFGGSSGDGSGPATSMVVGPDGAFYGTTAAGGTRGYGTVFELAPPTTPGGAWTETVLYSFTGPDGYKPAAPLVFGSNGVLYGTTEEGGVPCITIAGCGVVFSLAPPTTPGGAWTESVLYRFMGGSSDGALPKAGVVLGPNGSLLGTNLNGGTGPCYYLDSAVGCGSAFMLTPPTMPGSPWIETILHFFTRGQDGGEPGAMVRATDGALYGVTGIGGTGQAGTIFHLKL